MVKMTNDFNDFRFKDLNYKQYSNNYFTMDRLNKDLSKIIIKVSDEHLIQTQFGYAFILDRTHVVFLKNWQVSQNYYGNEVLLTKEYFNIKEWGKHENFANDEKIKDFNYFIEIAKEQSNYKNEDEELANPVRWAV